MESEKSKYKVLIIDDSVVVRKSLKDIIDDSEDFMVIGTAQDPYEARQILRSIKPDVVTLDIEMPRMNGLAFLDKLMRAIPLPVIMISSATQHNAMETLKALELGAVDYIPKPSGDYSFNAEYMREEVLEKLKSAVKVPEYYLERKKRRAKAEKSKTLLSAEEDLIVGNARPFNKPYPLIAIGASTGGTVAIEQLLLQLKCEVMPPIVIVQHIPPVFSTSFARRLDNAYEFNVYEAENERKLEKGDVVIAPGDRHMLIDKDSGKYFVRVKDGMKVNRHIPSVDVLFRSVAKVAASNAIGIILTGMGRDGAMGLLDMKGKGALSIAQSPHECAVESMPVSAKTAGAVRHILSLKGIAAYLNKVFGKK